MKPVFYPENGCFEDDLTEAKIGHNLFDVTLELQQQLDELIRIDDKRLVGITIVPEKDTVVVQNTQRLIHEYATASNIPGVMSRTSIETQEGEPAGDAARLEIAQAIQGWLLKGVNPFKELGIVDANELLELSSDNDMVALSDKDRVSFLAAMELGSGEYARSSAANYGDLRDENIRNGEAGLFDISSELDDQHTFEQPVGRIKKIGRAVSRIFKPATLESKLSSKELPKNVTSKRVLKIGVVAVLSLGAVFVGARNLGSENVSSNSSDGTYEISESTTTVVTATTEPITTLQPILSLPIEESRERSQRSVVEKDTPIVAESPAPSTNSVIPETISIVAGSNLWNELQVIVAGDSGPIVDANSIVEAVVSEAVAMIADENKVSVGALGQLNIGQRFILSDNVRNFLQSYRLI